MIATRWPSRKRRALADRLDLAGRARGRSPGDRRNRAACPRKCADRCRTRRRAACAPARLAARPPAWAARRASARAGGGRAGLSSLASRGDLTRRSLPRRCWHVSSSRSCYASNSARGKPPGEALGRRPRPAPASTSALTAGEFDHHGARENGISATGRFGAEGFGPDDGHDDFRRQGQLREGRQRPAWTKCGG